MNKLQIVKTNKFKRHFRKVSKWSKFNKKQFKDTISKLINLEKLDAKYKDHKLTGELEEYRECHIQPDLLLIYQINGKELILVLFDIGNHSDIFR